MSSSRKRKITSRYEARVKVAKALAHASRLLILEALSRKERCVYELRDLVGDDISTVSRHLSVLREAGVVESEKRGLQVYYSLRTPCVLDIFRCIDAALHAKK
jgi:ArsR family transcriptional regulator